MVNQSTPTCAMSPKATTTTATATAQPMPRFKIYFQDDAVRQRSQQAVQQLLVSAASDATTTTTSNCALLAKKALKYRKVLDRLTGVDVTSPEFDASKFLGVDWCKTQSLKAHCMRQQ